jgi:hypothetical protein
LSFLGKILLPQNQKQKNEHHQASRKKPTIPPDSAISGSAYGSIVRYNNSSIATAAHILTRENI